jgi:hypothetical protein
MERIKVRKKAVPIICRPAPESTSQGRTKKALSQSNLVSGPSLFPRRSAQILYSEFIRCVIERIVIGERLAAVNSIKIAR